ncbi:hypothetical protein VUR80DRAFT_883 [Thermomyces stellatus]
MPPSSDINQRSTTTMAFSHPFSGATTRRILGKRTSVLSLQHYMALLLLRLPGILYYHAGCRLPLAFVSCFAFSPFSLLYFRPGHFLDRAHWSHPNVAYDARIPEERVRAYGVLGLRQCSCRMSTTWITLWNWLGKARHFGARWLVSGGRSVQPFMKALIRGGMACIYGCNISMMTMPIEGCPVLLRELS